MVVSFQFHPTPSSLAILIMFSHGLFDFPRAVQAFGKDHIIARPERYGLLWRFHGHLAFQYQACFLFIVMPGKLGGFLFPRWTGLHLLDFLRVSLALR